MLFPAEGLLPNEITRCCQYGLDAVAPFGTRLSAAGENDTVWPMPLAGRNTSKTSGAIVVQLFMFSRQYPIYSTVLPIKVYRSGGKYL